MKIIGIRILLFVTEIAKKKEPEKGFKSKTTTEQKRLGGENNLNTYCQQSFNDLLNSMDFFKCVCMCIFHSTFLLSFSSCFFFF